MAVMGRLPYCLRSKVTTRASAFLGIGLLFMVSLLGCRDSGASVSSVRPGSGSNRSLVMALASPDNQQRCFFFVDMDAPSPIFFKIHEKPYRRTSIGVSDARDSEFVNFLWSAGESPLQSNSDLAQRPSPEVPFYIRNFLATLFANGHLDDGEGACERVLIENFEDPALGTLALSEEGNRRAWLFHGLLCLVSASVTQFQSCGSAIEKKQIPIRHGVPPIVKTL